MCAPGGPGNLMQRKAAREAGGGGSGGATAESISSLGDLGQYIRKKMVAKASASPILDTSLGSANTPLGG